MNTATKMLKAARRERDNATLQAAARIVVWASAPPEDLGEKVQRDLDLLALCKLLGMTKRTWRS